MPLNAVAKNVTYYTLLLFINSPSKHN